MTTGPRKINPPFRGDHVGSFLRPDRLKAARDRAGLALIAYEDKTAGAELSRADLTEIEDECIREVVRLQEDIGLKAVTDGEFRRGSWAYDVLVRIEGIELKPQETDQYHAEFKGSGNRPPIAHAVGKLRRPAGGLVTEDYLFTKSLTDRMVKATMPTPTLMYVRGGRAAVSEEVYPDIEEYFDDVGQVYRDEIAALAAEGCAYVQIDSTDAALLCDPKYQEEARQLGFDPMDQLSLQGRLVSGATRGRPDNVTVAMHVCRGNSAGSWMAEGGYEYVAEKLFNEFDIDAFFLEYDTERAGDFAPLRFVPRDRCVVLGLVTTKTPENDSKDVLKQRIDEAAKYLPLENLALSPQCGFASAALGNPVTVDDQRRKLELVLEVAEEVWGSV